MKVFTRKFLAALAVFALTLSWAAAPLTRAEVSKALIVVTADGSAHQLTTNTTIYSAKITFKAGNGNGAAVYIGDSSVSSTNCYADLTAGQAYTITPSVRQAENGEMFQLSDFYTKGTASDKIFVSYEVGT